MQEAYRQAESISAEVRARERAEQVSIDEKIEKDLSLLT